MPQKDCENFRKDLKDRLKEAIHTVAGKPDGRVRPHSCLLHGKINEGKGASFDNVGRKYNVCTTAKHDHTWLPQYTTGPLPYEILKRLETIRAGHDDLGVQYNPADPATTKDIEPFLDAICTITDKAFNDVYVYAETGHLLSSLPSTPSPLPSPSLPSSSPPASSRFFPYSPLPPSSLPTPPSSSQWKLSKIPNMWNTPSHSPAYVKKKYGTGQRLQASPTKRQSSFSASPLATSSKSTLDLQQGKCKRAPEPEVPRKRGKVIEVIEITDSEDDQPKASGSKGKGKGQVLVPATDEEDNDSESDSDSEAPHSMSWGWTVRSGDSYPIRRSRSPSF
ncbi:hypothetical protein PM082_022404 [Marasmius tenuissimus]|nr:hypothetical protein PM082_022404 [Marasmius tenuissimus]